MGSTESGCLSLSRRGWIVLFCIISLPLFSFGKGEVPPQPAPQQNPSPGESTVTGGFVAVELNDPMVEEAFFYLKEKLLEHKQDIEGLELVQAERQVVAGYNIRLIFQYKNGEEGRALVYFPLDDSPKEVLLEENTP